MSSRLLPPDSPRSSSEDSDDLDLVLSELDPSSSSFDPLSTHSHRYQLPRMSREHRRSIDRRRTSQSAEEGSSVPLRNLKKNGDDGADGDKSAEQRGTVSEDLDSDEAPLLRPDSAGKRSKLASKLRLSSFSPGSRRARDATSPPPPTATSLNSRTVLLSKPSSAYPANVISNSKYTPFTFLPLTLYNEFKFFFNLYFLFVALSQIVPALRIGYLSTYIVPLAGVLAITLGKEAYDDVERRRRDAEANGEQVECLIFQDLKKGKKGTKNIRGRRNEGDTENGDAESHRIQVDPEDGSASFATTIIKKKSKDIKVGDVLYLRKDQRVPADVIILKTLSEKSSSLIDNETVADAEDENAGEAFIRTDQLDGETDWKLRIATPLAHSLATEKLLDIKITATAPSKEINSFMGNIEVNTEGGVKSASLTVENTAWANTVLASSNPTLVAVIYTGTETRQALSTSKSRSKSGLLEEEINNLTKILCALTFTLSILLVVLHDASLKSLPKSTTDHIPERKWYIAILRFLILFSSIIPISLRVNLDMGKLVYAWFIERDEGIKGTIVRTSTIPEELGRVEYLLTDKTGTLTQNDMELRKVHVGTVSYAGDAMDEVSTYVQQGFSSSTANKSSADNDLLLDTKPAPPPPSESYTASGARSRREIGSRVRDVVLALALAHNVTPTTDDSTGETSYQAASPDEIAIVRWTESVGLKLVHRDRKGMVLQSATTRQTVVRVQILDVFPFTSEGKRMGIVVKFVQAGGDADSGDIWFFQKGADTIMAKIVAANDWLEEECGNMAREGLRTLVIGRKKLSAEQYRVFAENYKAASLILSADRDSQMQKVVSEHLEQELELLGVTGVEDKLQRDVKPSLELLRNAGIRIWMLTGDKVETARCIAVSSKLVGRGQFIYTVEKLKGKDAAFEALEFLRNKPDSCLLIDGESLALFIDSFQDSFISLAIQLPAVVACRCTPTQKADIARLIRTFSKKRICCIGDGGNDVSMIQAADVGVGIVGKEGRQASLAADFSIEQFCHLVKLLLWHGRCSYKRSAKLAQFVIHRGLIVSVCQTMFSIASRFEPLALYQGWLLVGYATLYTMWPVFSLVLDRDVDEGLANLYPELYKEVQSGRSLSYRTFLIWVVVSIYQGGVIQGLSELLTSFNASVLDTTLNAGDDTAGTRENIQFKRMVSISYTALVLCELCMVALEITTWHKYMVVAEVGTLLAFFASFPFLSDYFDLKYLLRPGYYWKFAVALSVAVAPIWIGKTIRRRMHPPTYAKVRGI